MASNIEQRRRLILSYRTKVVETITLLPIEKRLEELEKYHFNVMNLPAEDVYMDFTTDTGSSALSTEQRARMVAADETYVKPPAFYKLESTVRELFGFEFVIPAHQGRGGQQLIDFLLIKPNTVVPGNGHFWAVKADIQLKGGDVIECVVPYSPSNTFGGNLDIQKLEEVLTKYGKEKTPYILVSMTCNIRGGQPISMQNIRDVSKLAKKYGTLLIADCARFAENACFIQNFEDAYASKSIREIVKEMFSYFDACVMSGKKDGLVSTGGFVCVRDAQLSEKLRKPLEIFEGYSSNGGMSSATMEGFAKGLEEVTEDIYCNQRMHRIRNLANRLDEIGIPVVKPCGGHGFVIDARMFFQKVAVNEYPAFVLAAELYVEGGIRLHPHRSQSSNGTIEYEYCYLCVPRRVYSTEHLEYVIDVIRTVFVTKSNELTTGFRVNSNQVDAVNPNFVLSNRKQS